MSNKKVVTRNKTTKYDKPLLGKFGKLNLLLDNVRLNRVKHTKSLRIAKKIKSDDKLIEAMKYIDFKEESEKVELLKSIKNQDKRLKALDILNNDNDKVKVARTLDDNKKKEAIKSGIIKDYQEQVKLISSFEKDEDKMTFINIVDDASTINTLSGSLNVLQDIEDYNGKAEILESALANSLPEDVVKKIKEQLDILKEINEKDNDDEKTQDLSRLQSDFLKSEVIKTIKDDEKKIEALTAYLKKDVSKGNVIKSLEDDDKKIEMIKLLNDEDYVLSVIDTISDEKKLEAIPFIGSKQVIERIENIDIKIMGMTRFAQNSDELDYYIRGMELQHKDKIKNNEKFEETKKLLKNIKACKKEKNEDKKIEFIDSIENEDLKLELILTIKDENKKIDALCKLKPETIKKFRQNCEDRDFIKNNLDKFIQLEGVDSISHNTDMIIQMYETNNDIVKNIDFRILEDKYIETLGIDKINQISCYPNVQKKILELKDNELQIFTKCIDVYIEKNNTDSWTEMAQLMLDNFSGFAELVDNIQEIQDEDVEKLAIILQDENEFEIKSLEQLRNYDSIKKEKCDKWMEHGIIGKKKAVLEKLYGRSYKYAHGMVGKYGEDIDGIADGESKAYIQSFKSIVELKDPEILEKIYHECEETKLIDKIAIERELKAEYAKKYNEGLFKPEDGKKIKNGIYEAGTDFKIIMTSIGAYFNTDIENYREDWNRPAIASQHFCTSYIRNDMLGTAPINNIVYRIL